MRKTIYVLVCFFLFISSFSQDITLIGKVIDDLTKEPISYVNIGIFQKNLGTVSDENGDFKLKIPSEFTLQDSVVFSHVLFRPLTFSVKELQQFPSEISLIPLENELTEVVFESKSLKEKRIGRKGKGLGLMHWNFYSVHEEEVDDRLSKEVGMNFKLSKNCRFETFNLAISSNQFKSIRFRLNIYDLKNDLPDSLLLSKDITFMLKDEPLGWQSIDLNQYDIYLKKELGEIVVTIQWLESEKMNGDSKFFGIPASQSPLHKIYYRNKAMGTWQSRTGSLSMYVDAKCSR